MRDESIVLNTCLETAWRRFWCMSFGFRWTEEDGHRSYVLASIELLQNLWTAVSTAVRSRSQSLDSLRYVVTPGNVMMVGGGLSIQSEHFNSLLRRLL